jgi:hypothetical protein
MLAKEECNQVYGPGFQHLIVNLLVKKRACSRKPVILTSLGPVVLTAEFTFFPFISRAGFKERDMSRRPGVPTKTQIQSIGFIEIFV